MVFLSGTIIFLGLAIKYIGFKEKDDLLAYPTFQKGMNYGDWTKGGYLTFTSGDSLRELAKTKTEWVALIVTWYQDKYNSTEIKPTHRTSSDEGLTNAIRKIHELGMKVMLKPHLDILDTSEGKWRGGIEFESPKDWQDWFDNYLKFITYYVEIANTENVELFCVGTELTSSTLGHPEEWQKIISQVRDIYRGRLTYAANWFEEFFQIKFWDLLDYAGVDPYFPLTEAKSPSLEELKTAWQPWIRELENWQAKINKPVIFTEIGYKSCEGAADNPWEHIPRGKLDLELQARCYQALLETFFNKEWLWGIYWWYWKPVIVSSSLTRDFTIQGKPAQEVVRRWYNKPDAGMEKIFFWRHRERVSEKQQKTRLKGDSSAKK